MVIGLMRTPTQQQALYYATALYDYVGASEHELSFYANDTIEILEERGEEWVYGRLNGYVGCVPRNYIQVHASRTQFFLVISYVICTFYLYIRSILEFLSFYA